MTVSRLARRVWPFLAHLPVVGWVFAAPLFEGKVPYFRDVSIYYYPNYVFLERSFREGLWPLWNSMSDAGAPFLVAYPVDLLLVWCHGAEAALRLDAPLHLALAMVGASWLARELGLGAVGAWAAGLFYGLSGYVLSSVSLAELFHATAWAPVVIASMLAAWRQPAPRTAAMLALALALQVSTLGGETILQTTCIGLLLCGWRVDRRRAIALVGAALLTAALTAPVLAGVHNLLQGTRRGQGFEVATALKGSVHPALFLDVLLPRFLGDPHTFSSAGYWGDNLFAPFSYPYFLSLYVGLGMALLALQAGPSPYRARLWLLAAVSVTLALGSYGPAHAVVALVLSSFRNPAKFLFTGNLALCLLAGQGLERARVRRASWGWTVPGVLLAVLGPWLGAHPDLPGRLFGGLVPDLQDPRALLVIATRWPGALSTAGLLCAGAMLAVRIGRMAPAAAALVAFDLAIANGGLNPFAERTFYRLRPAVQAAVERLRAESDARWFSYGVMSTYYLPWDPAIAARNSDVWLYYMDRQALQPRTHVLDGLDAAFEVDRVGWSPPGASLPACERVPSSFPDTYAKLREASVRWVVSFRPLPADRARRREQIVFPEIQEPLGIYEILDPLPRAYWIPDLEQASRVFTEGSVTRERLDAHTVRLRVTGLAGYAVVTEGWRPDWVATDEAGTVRPISIVNGRYWAIPTRGGSEVITVRYQPRWRTPSLVIGAAGLLAAAALGSRPGRRAAPGESALNS
jgi:hypothetical protein